MAKMGGCRKDGRAKRKREARQLPLSKFVRGLISFEVYFKLTNKGKK